MTDYAEHLRTDLACPGCESEVRVTLGSNEYTPYLARVIHTGGCPWFARHEAKEPGFGGAVPCSTRVTHRGPYKRNPDDEPVPAAAGPVYRVRPETCRVPQCGATARLYAAGWLCDPHKPGSQPRLLRSVP